MDDRKKGVEVLSIINRNGAGGVWRQKIIHGIPRTRQLGPGWCGHATLSMVLRYWGYDFNQTAIFTHLKGEVPEEKRFGQVAYVTMGELALAAMQLTNLKVTLATVKLYKKILERQPDFNPHHLLQDSLEKGYPCIVHHIDHFYIAFGFGDRKDRYYFIDSRNGKRKFFSYTHFEVMWSRPYQYEDPTDIDLRYSLLVIRPKKEQNKTAP